jgi:ribosomal protein L9
VQAAVITNDSDLAEPIRSLGTHEVTVRLHPEVEAAVTVEVAAQ